MYVCHNSLYVLSLVLRTFPHECEAKDVIYAPSTQRFFKNSNLFNLINIVHQV